MGILGRIRRKFDDARHRLHLSHDYRQVFSSPHGKRVLADILRNNYVGFSTVAVDLQGRVDSAMVGLNEGRRMAALGILARMKSPDGAEELLRQSEGDEEYEIIDWV